MRIEAVVNSDTFLVSASKNELLGLIGRDATDPGADLVVTKRVVIDELIRVIREVGKPAIVAAFDAMDQYLADARVQGQLVDDVITPP